MFTITFYSYKGGVGRTSALMNVAHRLCALGKRICVLDFDLEAPGLDAFEPSDRGVEPRAGLVEYVSDFVRMESQPDLSDYIYDISPKEASGKIFLFPAGRKDAAYQAQLSRLDWKILYKRQRGFLLMEAMKLAVETQFHLDYLLIDSRTGLSDASGICTLQLPDLVVLFFGLNDQNIAGTAQVYKTILNNKLNRGVKTLLVASPIPDVPQSFELKTERFEKARQVIGASPEVVLPYDSFMCFQETIVLANQTRALSKSYELLTKKLIDLNSEDVINLLQHAGELREAGDMTSAEIKYREIIDRYPNSPEVWMEFGRFSRIVQKLAQAERCFSKAYILNPHLVSALAELAVTELHSGDNSGARKHFIQFVSECQNFRDLMRYSDIVNEKNERALSVAGYSKAFSFMRDPTTALKMAEALLSLGRYQEAFDTYKLVLERAPTMLHLVFNAAYAASKIGSSEAAALHRKSVEIFESQDKKPATPKDLANIFGAISFSYYELGKKETALAFLKRAEEQAAKLQEGKIFSFPQYEWVSPPEFVKLINSRIENLTKELTSDSSRLLQ